jgi:hypothetical protein
MTVWIETLPERLDARDAVALKRIQKLPLSDLDSIEEALQRGVLASGFRRDVLDGAPEIIAHGQDVAREVGHDIARCVVLLPLGLAAQILHVGHGPEHSVAQIGILGDQGLNRACADRRRYLHGRTLAGTNAGDIC